jgi:hypothetical protein
MNIAKGALALVFVILMGTVASAQGSDRQPPNPSAPTQGNVEQQHPQWFTERYVYKPCPSAVEFPDGRSACLGMGGR